MLPQAWKDCIAVEMVNSPVLCDSPAEECEVQETEVVPMRLQRFLEPSCKMQHIYEYMQVPGHKLPHCRNTPVHGT